MALQLESKINLDGGPPGFDANGVYHLPAIKRGSTSPWSITFPSGDVTDYFWVAHFRKNAADPTEQLIARLSYAGDTHAEKSEIRVNGTTQVIITLDADEVAAMDVGNGVWDLEAWFWNTKFVPSAGFQTKDRTVSGIYVVTQDVTREDGPDGGVGA